MTLNRILFASALAAWLPLGVQACGAGSDSQNNPVTTNLLGDGGLLPDGGVIGGGGSGNGGAGNGTSGNGSGGDGTGTGDGDSGVDPSFPDGSVGAPTFPDFFFGDSGLAACTGDGCPQCANGVDDDGDGKIDGFDEECTGPADDDEGSFATGIPGDNRDPKWQDCFFDGNSGAGDDGCRYHTECLTGERPLTDNSCELSQQCIDFCRPLVPNGCDCFGCCEVHTDTETVFVQINSGCDFDDITDEAICPRCVQSTQCLNTCGECELCPGKSIEDLPETCFTDPPGGDGDTNPPGSDGGDTEPPPPFTCDEGETVCASSAGCEAGFYCQFGCCVKSVIF
jgi:hypothetical protein